MATKLVTLKNKKGDLYYPKTTAGQVIGLSDLLAGKQSNLTAEQLDAVNSGANAAVIGKITANENAINSIVAVIPVQATDTNELADKDFVNSTVQTMSADLISYNENGDPFPTKAALDNAVALYNGGSAKTPDEHDYCVVLADETHGGAQTRYTFSGGAWAFQFIVNDTPFTAAQNAAINSGITAEKVEQLNELAAGNGALLTKEEASETYAPKDYIDGLGTVFIVPSGADLSGFGDNDLIVELDAE